MDADGEIKGEVEIPTCATEELRKKNECPDEVTIKFYSVDGVVKTLVGTVEADVEERSKDGDKYYVYVFVFIVPPQYLCTNIVVFAVDPITGLEIPIQQSAAFKLWGASAVCDDFDPTKPVDPVDPANPSVTIDGVKQDERLVEVYGKCSGSADIVFSGDLNAMINKSDACASGVFKHCDFLSKSGDINHIVAKQTVASKSDEDSVDVMGGDQLLVLTYDEFKKDSANNKKITINGKCTPGGQISLTIYNNPIPKFTCPASGLYSYTGTPLVANLTNRVMFGELSAIEGKAAIKADVDMENVTPSCSITATAARLNFCTKQAGSVSGNCYVGLPVHVKVNGNYQNIGYCATGTYTVKNVLLQKVGVNNTITIEQKTPYGKSCSASKVLTSF